MTCMGYANIYQNDLINPIDARKMIERDHGADFAEFERECAPNDNGLYTAGSIACWLGY